MDYKKKMDELQKRREFETMKMLDPNSVVREGEYLPEEKSEEKSSYFKKLKKLMGKE